MKKPLLVLGAVAAGALAIRLWSGAGADHGAASDPQLVFNRIWLDHLPRNEKDSINAFAVLTREPVGVFQTASRWKGAYELFQHESSGSELRVVFPQTGEKERLRARAWSCKEGDMDYCLELAGSSRGVKRYRSRKGWEIGASAGIERARAEVESVVGQPAASGTASASER
jgi:hypothetical protein